MAKRDMGGSGRTELSDPPTETGPSTDDSGLYHPSPNPPFEPKPCQDCGGFVDGEEMNGLWLERECWQGPNRYELFCVSCCVDKLDVDTEHELEKRLSP